MNISKATYLAIFFLKNLFFMKIGGRIHRVISRPSAAHWNALRAKWGGTPVWLVVGNGPSLRVEDLDALRALPAIASNKINLLFKRTNWRPALYTIADPLVLHKLTPDHYSDFDATLIPDTHVFMAKTAKRLTWHHISDQSGRKKYVLNDEALSPTNGFFVGRTITCVNLQLAMWLNARTIYLIGCDHFYANEPNSGAAKRAEHRGESNHFDPDYRKPGEVVNAAPIDLMNQGYEMVRSIAKRRGVRIVNISRKTALDIFERSSVEQVLAELESSVGQPG